MTVAFTRWPEERAGIYRENGLWIDRPLTRLLEDQAQRRPNAPAIICGDRLFSYAELNRLSNNLSRRLAAAGIARGDTALVQLPNVAEFYIVFFALLKAGIVPVNALFSHRKIELLAYSTQIKPSLIIASRLHELFSEQAFLQVLDDQDIKPKLTLYLDEKRSAQSLDEWISHDNDLALDIAPTAADEVAFFQLSGGSTGTPKLIPRTHNDYDYSVRVSADICDLSEKTRFLCALPVAHNYPMSSPGALGVFHAGGCVVMARNPEPTHCFELIEKHRINMVALVPPAVALWLEAVPGSKRDITSLLLLQVGGASFSEATAQKVPEILGCKLQQVFGMAEGLVNYTRLDDPAEVVYATQGQPMSAFDEVRILDEKGQAVPDGTPGMLATRGPYTICGYYLSSEHNAQVFDKDGFYYSGDIVERSIHGNIRVVGRIKDQINRGGEKIAAEEIENLILRHPDITHAALVSIPDERLGEKSCAFIVTKNSELNAPSLRRYLGDLGIAEYKLPDRIRFIESMPLTAVGKLDKKALRSFVS